MRNVYNPSIHKVRNAGKMFCSSQCWSCATTDSVMRCCMTNHFCVLVNDNAVVAMKRVFGVK